MRSSGLCQCGCGEETRIATRNDPRTGEIKGQPVRYRKAHHHRGKVVSNETRAKLSAAQAGTGTSTGYRAIHAHLCKQYPKMGVCENCGAAPKKTVYALIHGCEYTRDRENYRELCEPCHVRYDRCGKPLSAEHRNKISAAKLGQKATRLAPRPCIECGISFSLANKHAKYCSHLCRKRAHRRAN